MPSDRHKRLRTMYGPEFPDVDALEGDKLAKGWQSWITAEVERQRSVMMDKRLHWARHRLFKQGRQWISSRDGRTWRELSHDKNRVRAVFNMIGPALDFRRALLQEQRPGFYHTPIPGMGVAGRETAQAQQAVAEYYFHTQDIWEDLLLEAMVQAQTDGVCFLNVFLDKTAGPTMADVELVSPEEERYGALAEQGYKVRDSGLIEVPIVGDEGQRGEPGDTAREVRGGDIRTRLVLAHETWADPEARTINGGDRRAKWFMVRRVRDLKSARIQLDDPKLEPDVQHVSPDPLDLTSSELRARFQRGLPPYPSTRVTLPEGGVYENLIYFAPSAEFPDGKWVEVISDRHVKGKDELPGGKVPIARVTDGSSDNELYPRPIMSDWIGDQMSINALGSKMMEFARLHSGSRLMALEGTTIKETWTDIVGAITEYKGPKPDVMPAPRSSPDMWRMWTMMIRQLEDKTGWTDVARGQLTGEGGFQDVAGRALLAARELFERQFGPMIRAAARGASDWAELVVVHAQHFFETPRLIPMVGRPDLAMRIDKDRLEGPPSVYVDPETLQPLPRALRNQLLTDYLDRGLITMKEFKKEAPFAELRDLNYGDSDQWNRAQMVNTTLEMRWEELIEMDALELYDVETGLAIFWQDDVEIHMSALEEIILDDRKPFGLRKLASDRWGIYEELGKSKHFPVQLELQGVPRPPAPAEVVGVPNVVQQRAEVSQQRIASAGGAPGGAPAGTPAPEISGAGAPGAGPVRGVDTPPATMAGMQQ